MTRYATCVVCGAPTPGEHRNKTCSRACTTTARAEGTRRAWQDPEHRAARLARQRAVMQTPEYRAAISRAGTGRVQSPETRAAIGRANAVALRGKGIGNRNALDAPVKGECAYCGQPAQAFDHVLPRREPYGGSDDPVNIVPACYACNTSKGRRDPWAWLAAGLYATKGAPIG